MVTTGWSVVDGALWSKVSAPGCTVLVNPTYRVSLRWSSDTPPAVTSYDLSQTTGVPQVQFGATTLDASTGTPKAFATTPLTPTSGKADVTALPDPAVFSVSAGSLTDVTLAGEDSDICFHLTLSPWDTTK